MKPPEPVKQEFEFVKHTFGFATTSEVQAALRRRGLSKPDRQAAWALQSLPTRRIQGGWLLIEEDTKCPTCGGAWAK